MTLSNRAAIVADLQNLDKNPQTCRQIADRYGVEHSRVRAIAWKLKIPIVRDRAGRPRSSGVSDEQVDRVLLANPRLSRMMKAQLAGTSPAHIYQRAKALGLPREPGLTFLQAFLLDLNRGGLSCSQIALLLGRTRQAIWAALQRAERLGYKVYSADEPRPSDETKNIQK